MRKLGWWITILLTILPIIYLIILDPARFSSFELSLYSLGKMFALSGTILFALTLFLHTRFLFLEKLFGGLDKVYKAHHIFGATSFLLLLFHPLFLASFFAMTSLQSALSLLIPGTANTLAINLGIIALLAMELFLVLTFFVKLPYQTWKFTHQFLGYAFIIASFHVLLIPSDTSRDPVLRLYFILFIILGIGSFLYRKFFWKYLGQRHNFKVSQVKMLSPAITEITLAPEKKLFSFVPGQFIFISFRNSKIPKEFHPFTISSGNNEPVIRLSIKKLGDYTNQLPNLQKNTKAIIEGPFGMFCPSLYTNKKQIWIAGGIGITPFLSMVRSLNPKDTRTIDLYYSVVTKEEAIFLDEFQAASKTCKNFRVFPFYAKEQGYLSMEYIAKNSKLKDAELFLCGPPPMMLSLKKQAKSKGIRSSKIHMEEFAL